MTVAVGDIITYSSGKALVAEYPYDSGQGIRSGFSLETRNEGSNDAWDTEISNENLWGGVWADSSASARAISFFCKITGFDVTGYIRPIAGKEIRVTGITSVERSSIVDISVPDSMDYLVGRGFWHVFDIDESMITTGTWDIKRIYPISDSTLRPTIPTADMQGITDVMDEGLSSSISYMFKIGTKIFFSGESSTLATLTDLPSFLTYSETIESNRLRETTLLGADDEGRLKSWNNYTSELVVVYKRSATVGLILSEDDDFSTSSSMQLATRTYEGMASASLVDETDNRVVAVEGNVDYVKYTFDRPYYVAADYNGLRLSRDFIVLSSDPVSWFSIPKPENEVEAQSSENEVIYYTPTANTVGFDLYDEVEGAGETLEVKTYLGTTQEIKDNLISDGYTLVETYEPNIGIEVPDGNELVIYNLVDVTATTNPADFKNYWKELHIFDLVGSIASKSVSDMVDLRVTDDGGNDYGDLVDKKQFTPYNPPRTVKTTINW